MLSSKALIKIPGCLNLFIDGHPFPGLPGKATLSYSSAAMAMRGKKSKQKMTERNGSIVVRAGYTRRPMDTPGAYELIDEVSGEKVIVWGGDDDEDSHIPPKHVIAWNPGQVPRKAALGNETQTSVRKGDAQTTSTRRSSRAFGRLKVDKVRKLVKKAVQDRQETSESEVEEELGKEITIKDEFYDDDDYISLDSEDEFSERKQHRTVKQGDDQLHKYQVTAKKSTEVARDSSRTKSTESTIRSKGWGGGGEPTYNSQRYSREPQDRWKQSGYNDFFSRKLFKELGCSPDMLESLRRQDFVRSSHIQAMAFQPVLGGKSCIMADQSGSGKTLAYLAPIVQRLRQEELQGLSKSSSGSPRAVILVPTAELASQVLKNCRALSKFGVPFRSMVATGGFRQKTQLESLQQDLDVLIATPGRFIAVLDEVDILFGDEDFEVVLQSLITRSPFTTQYVFVTATLPLDIYNKLVTIFPDCEVVMGPGVHRTSTGLEEVLVDCSGNDAAEKTPETAFSNKKTALLNLVEKSPVAKTIVFCNKIETCRKVENALKRRDRKENQIKVLPFHAALEQEKRLTNMKQFLESRSDNESQFLICTDRASRGIDFAEVDHVVLFDFPRDPSEYVRRVGRTARGAQGTGKAFVFAVGKQVSLARRIMERNEKGHPLHEVPASYELMRSGQADISES
ncbi:hypothetical protein V2J09_001858 [Rumex salicifolius]